MPGVFQHSRQKKKREAKLKKKQFFSYSIVLHVMHADILPIATILITYCLFIVYFIFWVAHRVYSVYRNNHTIFVCLITVFHTTIPRAYKSCLGSSRYFQMCIAKTFRMSIASI